MQLRNDFGNLDVLVLHVDGAAGCAYGRAVLVEIGSLAGFDIEGASLRRCPPIGVAAGMGRALNLNARGSALGRHVIRKRQISFAAGAPAAVVWMTLARFVPALHEVMMDVRDRWAGKLDVDVVVLAFAAVSG